MRFVFFVTLSFVTLCGAASADITNYNQDFESMQTAVSNAGNADLANDGWWVNGTEWAGLVGDKSTFLSFYGNFPAPNYNGNPGFSGIVDNQGTGGQGIRHLNIYSDYAHPTAHAGPNGDAYVEARVFREQVIGVRALNFNSEFSFEYKRNFENGQDLGPSGNTDTFAFIRVLDPQAGFATLAQVTFETTTAAQLNTWNSQTINLLIDSNWYQKLLQYGFYSEAQDSNNSGVLYDNLNFRGVPEPGSAAVLGVLGIGLFLRRRRRG